MKRALSAYLRSGKKLVRPIAVVILTLVLFGLTDTSMPTGQVAAAKPLAAASLTPIKHVVFIIKENRTFDNYFGTFPGANGATKFTNVNGKVRPLNHTPDSTASGIGHRWQHARLAWNNGRMNQFALIPGAIQNGVDVADSQLYESDIPNYWAYARTYALADKFFSSIMANSFPNHLFTIAAVGKNVDDNPFFPSAPLPRWGCDAPAGTLVRQRQANGTVTYTFPCFRIKTLGALLTEYGISWKYSTHRPRIRPAINGRHTTRFTVSDRRRNGGSTSSTPASLKRMSLPAICRPSVGWFLTPTRASMLHTAPVWARIGLSKRSMPL